MIQRQYKGAGVWDTRRLALILAGAGEFDPKRIVEVPAAGQSDRVVVSRRILVIEDNKDAAETLRDYLELCGYEVYLAYTGPAGLEAAARFLPDVVLCDIGLPGMDGWNVARSIRSAPETAAARLIAITGYGAEEDRRQSVEAGFEAHLTKPVDIDQLEALLARGA